jgi:cell wall-associated NlpC family hydrolase
MRRLIAAVLVALACAGTAHADTFNVVAGTATLPSADTPNAPGDIVLPANIMQPPATRPAITYDQMLSLWQHAGTAYGIPWEVLAAINEVESGFGADMGPSSANAIGWMQFLPSTWDSWGVDGDGDGVADPWNPTDAVYAAARYLAAAHGREDLYRAVFAYNHADWYVQRVLGLAGEYLANPFHGRDLLYAPPGAVLPDAGPSATQRLQEARAQLQDLQQREADLQAALGDGDQTLLQAKLASGDATLSDRAFARAQQHVDAISSNQEDRQQELVDVEQQIASTEAEVQILEQSSLNEQQGTLLTGGLEALTGKPSTPEVAAVIDYAVRQLGVPYHWGGNHGFGLQDMVSTDPNLANGFDCSSLVAWSYAKGAGIYIGDYTGTQWALGATAAGAIRGPGPAQGGTPPPGGFQPGDIIFFNDTEHVALYLGNDLFIHAPHTGDVVRIARLSQYPLQVWGWVRYQQVEGIPFTSSGSQVAAPIPVTPQVFTVVGSTAGDQPTGRVFTFTR